MQAGVLTELISIEQSIKQQNAYGANSTKWVKVINTRAKVTYSSGNRATENNEIIFNYNVIFTVRYYHKITEDMRKQLQTLNTELIND